MSERNFRRCLVTMLYAAIFALAGVYLFQCFR